MQFHQLREQKGSGVVGDGITQWTQIQFSSKILKPILVVTKE